MSFVSLPITTLYAGILGLAFALTSLRVGLTRASTGKLYGTDKDSSLEHLVRSAGTIGEFGFPGLFLLALLEYNSILSHSLLWWAGLILTVARILHSWQLSSPQNVPIKFREGSFLTTIGYFAFASLALLLGAPKN